MATQSSGFSMSETSQVFIPLNRQKIFLFVVTILTGRHKITLGAFSASNEGDDMIHG